MKRFNVSVHLTKVSVSLRDLGLRHTLKRITEDILFRKLFLFRNYFIVEKQLDGAGQVELRNPQLDFKFIHADDSEILKQIQLLSGLTRGLVLKLLNNGGECVVAIDNGNMVGFNLVSTGQVYLRYLCGHVSLSNKQAWSEQTAIKPSYRRTGVSSDLRHIMFDHLARKGYSQVIGGYVPANKNAALVDKKLGYVVREKVTLYKVLWWRKYLVKRLSPTLTEPLPIASVKF